VNSEWLQFGELEFMGELELAQKVALIVVVVQPDTPLSPRMRFIVDVSLKDREDSRQVMVMPLGRSGSSPHSNFPAALSTLPCFPGHGEELLALRGEDYSNNASLCSQLFHFLLGMETDA
jgi:hypothetical protein